MEKKSNAKPEKRGTKRNGEPQKNGYPPRQIAPYGAGTSGTDDTKLLAAAADFPLQLIEGYKGTAAIRVAAEQGEVDGTCAFGWQSAKVTCANALRARQIHVVLQTTLEPHPELKGVPLAVEYAKTEEGKKTPPHCSTQSLKLHSDASFSSILQKNP